MNIKGWVRHLLEQETVEPLEKKPVVDTTTTMELLLDGLHQAHRTTEEEPDAQSQSEPMYAGSFAIGWSSDVGRVRGQNEDALYIFTTEAESQRAVPPMGIFILADGMGGHQAGELASALAVQETASHLVAQMYLPLLRGMSNESLAFNEIVRDAILQANSAVSENLPGSGSTLTCSVVIGERLLIGHVGDSRAYLWRRDEGPRQLTTDHSLVNRLVELGQITEEEAAIYPQRNVLYRAIGQGKSLEVDVSTAAVHPGDRILLCCDGLWGMVEESEIWRIIESSATPQAACERLVRAANMAGGNDNISVILIELL